MIWAIQTFPVLFHTIPRRVSELIGGAPGTSHYRDVFVPDGDLHFTNAACADHPTGQIDSFTARLLLAKGTNLDLCFTMFHMRPCSGLIWLSFMRKTEQCFASMAMVTMSWWTYTCFIFVVAGLQRESI